MPLTTILLCSLALPQDSSTPDTAQQALSWKDLTKSGIPLRFYGFLRMDSYFNTARMNNIILPITVSPEDGVAADDDDSGFAFDPRLTRFGFDLAPGNVAGTEVNGKLEVDFANFPSGSVESRATPRIRLAYLDLAEGDLGVRIGQDWDVISPLYPAVNHETLMWNTGNTGDRRAQIQGRWTPKDSAFSAKASLGLTGAVTNEDLDTGPGSTPERDGFDSGIPHLQARAAWKSKSWVEGKQSELGAWGAVGQTETDTSFGGEKHFDVRLFGLDLQLPLTEVLGLRGELWTGENLADFRGGIGQSINTTTGDEISSVGGWAELAYSASQRTRFHLGATMDDPDDDDIASGKASRNSSEYVGVVHDWANGTRMGFDVIRWETEWKELDDGDGLRFNLYFQYNF